MNSLKKAALLTFSIALISFMGLTQAITGDLTGDCKVDIYDIVKLVHSYQAKCFNDTCSPDNSCWGDYTSCDTYRNWNPKADVIQNGVINIYDVVEIAKHYGERLDCDDGVACTVDGCVEGSCSNTPEDSQCDDDFYCNGQEYCDVDLGCQAGNEIDCSSLSDQCNDGVCDEDLDDCVQDSTSHEGLTCDDGLYCNVDETCQSGVCTGGLARDCSGNDMSGIDTCFNIPDNYNFFTWDFRQAFTSFCDEFLDACTNGDGMITHTCNQPTCRAECDENPDCVDYCSGVIRYYSGTCDLGDCNCSYSTEDCNDYDCTTGLTCNHIDLDIIGEGGDDYTCSASTCSVVGTMDCFGPWACDSGSECSSQACGGTDRYCYYDAGYEWGDSYPGTETDCEDGYDNDCDGLTDGEDTDCCNESDCVILTVLYSGTPVPVGTRINIVETGDGTYTDENGIADFGCELGLTPETTYTISAVGIGYGTFTTNCAGGADVTVCIPSEEICDGLDNDCDFQIDEDDACTGCVKVATNPATQGINVYIRTLSCSDVWLMQTNEAGVAVDCGGHVSSGTYFAEAFSGTDCFGENFITVDGSNTGFITVTQGTSCTC